MLASPVRVLGQCGNAYKTAGLHRRDQISGPNKVQDGRHGLQREDQIITVAIEKAGVKMIYVPFKGGGDVAVQLVGKHIDSTVNNPIEAVAQWRAGSLRPLCVFDNSRMPYKAKVTDTMSWYDVPTCKEAGLAIEYVMPRVFRRGKQGSGGFLRVVQESAEPRLEEVHEGRIQADVHDRSRIRSGWRRKDRHRDLMREAGFSPSPSVLTTARLERLFFRQAYLRTRVGARDGTCPCIKSS
jgi:hypothetical protein